MPFVCILAGCVTHRVQQGEQPPMVIVSPRSADTTGPPQPPPMERIDAPGIRGEGVRDVRVALATAAQGASLTATGTWRLFDSRDAVLVRARANDEWTLERRGHELRALRGGSGATPWSEGHLTLRPDGAETFGVFAGRRYRGAIRVVASDTGLVIVNVLPVESYLRGVVPLEIGITRGANEQAAVEAQAVA
ncbi:MAG: SpoIID/LytB domain-containing protein, partial [Gemmatimonadales bacterium]